MFTGFLFFQNRIFQISFPAPFDLDAFPSALFPEWMFLGIFIFHVFFQVIMFFPDVFFPELVFPGIPIDVCFFPISFPAPFDFEVFSIVFFQNWSRIVFFQFLFLHPLNCMSFPKHGFFSRLCRKWYVFQFLFLRPFPGCFFQNCCVTWFFQELHYFNFPARFNFDFFPRCFFPELVKNCIFHFLFLHHLISMFFPARFFQNCCVTVLFFKNRVFQNLPARFDFDVFSRMFFPWCF